MSTAYDDVARLSATLAKTTEPEARARLTAELKTAAARLTTSTTRKAPFIEDDVAERRSLELRIRDLYTRPAKTDQEREAAKFFDDNVMTSALLHNRDVRSTRFWNEGLEERPWLRKAMDTSAGADWIPTEISSELHAQVRLECRVASLLQSINMPTPTYRLPIGGEPATSWLVSEQADPDADLDASKRVPASDVQIGNVATLTARKLATRVVPTVELLEDSIIPALPFITAEITRAMAVAVERAIISGKRTGPALDSDVTNPADAAHWFDGLRQYATGAAAGNGTAVAATSTAGRLEVGDLLKIKAKMGRFGLVPQDCVWVANSTAYNQLLNLSQNGFPVVVTVDKFGNQATVQTGAVGNLFGSSVVLSQFVPENCNRSGYVDGITTDSSLLLCINKKQYVFGTYRNPTLKSRQSIETDALVLVSMMRGDFTTYVPTPPTFGGYPVGMIYDVRRTS